MNTIYLVIKSCLIAILVANSFSCGVTSSTVDVMSVESTLKLILEKSDVPADLQITYDDMHGLWGGTTIVISGKGSGERRERERGNSEPEIFGTSVTREQLIELVKLLVEHEAWEQRTPDRDPVPDESRASLRIQVNGQTSAVWEWFNDMKKNERLIKIKARMKQMTT